MPVRLGSTPGPVQDTKEGVYVGNDLVRRMRSRAVTLPEPPSLLERTAGALLVGAHENFLLKPVMDQIAGAFPGVSPEVFNRMQARLAGDRLSSAFEFVGEFGPDLAAGFGAFGLGRIAAVRALAWAGRTGTGARLLPASARTAARYAPGGGVGGTPVAKPVLERGAEIAGGATGLGGYSGVQTLAEGGELDDAGRAALISAVLVGGMETGLTLAFSRLARARQVDVGKVEGLLERSQRAIRDEQGKIGEKIGKLNEQIEKTNDRVSQQLSLAQARLAKARGADPTLPGFEGVAYNPPERLKQLERALIKAEEKADKFYDEKLPLWEREVVRLEHKGKALEEFRAVDPGGAIYTRGEPYNPKNIRLMFSQLGLKLLTTPESFRGSLGPSFARIYRQLDTAETMTMVARSKNTAKVTEWVERSRQALGLTRKQVRKDRAVFLPVFSAWEEAGERGVREYMARIGRSGQADDMLAVFGETDNAMLRIYQPLVDMGAEPALTTETLGQLGVQKYLPHLFDDLPEDQVMAALASKFGEARAAQMWDAYTREGLGRFSSIDFNRTLAGPLSEKIAKGLPYDPNPFNNLFRYLNRTHRRFEYGSRFGFEGELKEPMLKAVGKEGGSTTLAGNIMDIALDQQYYPRAMRQLSRMALGTQIFSKLTLAVIPNASQPMNLLLWGGIRHFGKGFLGAVRAERRDEVMAATALSESLVRGPVGKGFGVDRAGPALLKGQPAERLANAADKAGWWMLSRTGFSAVERWNRVWSGTGAHYMFRDTLAKAVNGRLRGNSLDIGRRRMEAMGANLDDLVRKVRAGGDDFLTSPEFRQAEILATFKGAQQTQFIPSVTRRPLLWNHPIGRVFTQFKTFALNQGRFIRDQVFAEAARGNLRPMAYFLSFYPVAGEVVGEVRSVARGRPRDREGVTRFLEDFAMVGGIGLFTDTFVAARYGRLAGSIFGPTIGDSVQFAERMVQADVDGVYKMVQRQPVMQAVTTLTALGILTTRAMDEYLEQFPAFESEGAERPTAIDFGLARHREIMKKGQPR